MTEVVGVHRGPRHARAYRGRATGPIQTTGTIMATGTAGSYRSLRLVVPEIARRASPGQFVSLAVEGHTTLLRRPFSIAGATTSAGGGSIEVLYHVGGPGTRWLAERDRHTAIDVVGPLGHGFPMPREPVPCLLVGGGYGAAPLLWLARRLRGEGCRVDLVMGAATADRLVNPMEAKRLVASATTTTDDGSAGVHGRVTDVLDDVIDRAGTRIVYACGPMAMLEGVTHVAAARRLPCKVAVEEAMACGVGVCMTCVVPVDTPDGPRNVRACYEGPVLDGRRVAWDLVGRSLSPVPEPPAPPAVEEPLDAGPEACIESHALPEPDAAPAAGADESPDDGTAAP